MTASPTEGFVGEACADEEPAAQQLTRLIVPHTNHIVPHTNHRRPCGMTTRMRTAIPGQAGQRPGRCVVRARMGVGGGFAGESGRWVWRGAGSGVALGLARLRDAA
jgi:hypothetical protein